MRIVVLAALLGACAPKRTELPAFTVDLQEPEAPELGPLPPPEPEDAPAASAAAPGERMPYTDERGRATHRVVVMPPVDVADLLRQEQLATFWERRAVIFTQGRAGERATCTTAMDLLQRRTDDQRLELRRQRTALWVGVVGAFVLGAGLTVATVYGVAPAF